MTVNELRVGNFYRSVKFRMEVKCDLADMYELCHRSYGAYNDPPIADIFEPIPINEYWWRKFGFSIRGYSRPAWLSQLSAYNITLVRKNGKTVEYCKGSPREIAMNIRYVHEYQNLYFALTGKEVDV